MQAIHWRSATSKDEGRNEGRMIGRMKRERDAIDEWKCHVTKLERWVNAKGTHARRHEFTAINEINASEEQAAQADKGDQFQFISIRNEKTEWNWTKCDARWSRSSEINSFQFNCRKAKWMNEWNREYFNCISLKGPSFAVIKFHLIDWAKWREYYNSTVIRAGIYLLSAIKWR